MRGGRGREEMRGAEVITDDILPSGDMTLVIARLLVFHAYEKDRLNLVSALPFQCYGETAFRQSKPEGVTNYETRHPRSRFVRCRCRSSSRRRYAQDRNHLPEPPVGHREPARSEQHAVSSLLPGSVSKTVFCCQTIRIAGNSKVEDQDFCPKLYAAMRIYGCVVGQLALFCDYSQNGGCLLCLRRLLFS